MRKILAAGLAAFLFIPRAWPAACEPFAGEWSLSSEVTPQEISEIQSIAFSGAYKVLTPRGDVRLHPEALSLAESYFVKMEWLPDVWIFRFFSGEKEVGLWRLTPSKDWSFFQTDPGISEITKNNVPMLYKEIRVGGDARPEGIFGSEASGKIRYKLIFQGTGSRCFECGDFRRWIFQIEGPDPEGGKRSILYSFFGSFEKSC